PGRRTELFAAAAAATNRVRPVSGRAGAGRGLLPRRYHRRALLVPLAGSITPTPLPTMRARPEPPDSAHLERQRRMAQTDARPGFRLPRSSTRQSSETLDGESTSQSTTDPAAATTGGPS